MEPGPGHPVSVIQVVLFLGLSEGGFHCTFNVTPGSQAASPR